MKLSLAMIVKNEAGNLGHCLGSAKGLVDEMIVVDTGSSDDTIAVATGNGAICKT
jgi:glycosyltransferase involved in cell wall biosynthesis